MTVTDLRVSIHQPGYFPWLGLVDKIARSDLFVALDNVQYNARAFQHRTLYSSPGGPRYLSLPVNSKGHQTEGRALGEMSLVDPKAPLRHFEVLRHRYARSPGWTRLEEPIASLLQARHTRLLDLTLGSLELTLRAFEIAVPLRLASELSPMGAKTELMVSLTRNSGGSTYLSGTGAKAYLEPRMFTEAGLELLFQDFTHPVYPQGVIDPFQPGCFALEWLIEGGSGVVDAFWKHLTQTGAPAPRNRRPSNGPMTAR